MRYLALAAIAALALVLRVSAIDWGLPDVHHPDEPYILNRALAFAKGDPSPHNFLYPTLYLYALFVWEGLFFVAGRLVGLYDSVAAFEQEFFLDPTRVMIAGRLLTALFGVATVAAVYRFGAHLYDRRVGLGAALLLAVSPFAVRDAHYIKLDVPAALFVVLSQAAVARIVVHTAAAARRGPWLFAGAMAGLACSTQYYAAPVVLTIAVGAAGRANRLGRWAGAVRPLAWAGLAAIAAFVATTPFLLLELDVAVRDMTAVREINVDRAVGGAGAFTSLGAYLRMLGGDAMGWATGLAAGAGFVLALAYDVPDRGGSAPAALPTRSLRGGPEGPAPRPRARSHSLARKVSRRGLVLACFPLVYLAFLANTVPMSRYVNVMLPSLAVAAAFAISRLASTRIVPRVTPAAAFAILLFLVGLPGLLGSIRSDVFFSQTDTRTLARDFIERTAPQGTGVLVQPHSVQLRPSRETLVEALRKHLGSESLASIRFQKQLEAASDMRPTYRVLYVGTVTDEDLAVDKMYVSPQAFDGGAGLEPLRAQQVAYVALNRYNTGGLAFESLDAALQQEAHLLAIFSPYRADVGPDRRAAIAPFFHNTADRIHPELERPGPVVEVWRID